MAANGTSLNGSRDSHPDCDNRLALVVHVSISARIAGLEEVASSISFNLNPMIEE